MCGLPSHGVLALPASELYFHHSFTSGSSYVVEPEIIGTLTGSLGTRHSTHTRPELQAAEGPPAREQRSEPILVCIAQAEGRLWKSETEMGVKTASLEATCKRKESSRVF